MCAFLYPIIIVYPSDTPVFFQTISPIKSSSSRSTLNKNKSRRYTVITTTDYLKTRLVPSQNKQTSNMLVSRPHAILLFAISSALPDFLFCTPTSFRPIFIVPNIRLFFGPPQPSTSKFPPIIELIVQRIQAQFSTYVYEDLSRPQTWDKPVYTLSPEEQATETATVSQNVRPTTQATVEEPERFVFCDRQWCGCILSRILTWSQKDSQNEPSLKTVLKKSRTCTQSV